MLLYRKSLGILPFALATGVLGFGAVPIVASGRRLDQVQYN